MPSSISTIGVYSGDPANPLAPAPQQAAPSGIQSLGVWNGKSIEEDLSGLDYPALREKAAIAESQGQDTSKYRQAAVNWFSAKQAKDDADRLAWRESGGKYLGSFGETARLGAKALGYGSNDPSAPEKGVFDRIRGGAQLVGNAVGAVTDAVGGGAALAWDAVTGEGNLKKVAQDQIVAGAASNLYETGEIVRKGLRNVGEYVRTTPLTNDEIGARFDRDVAGSRKTREIATGQTFADGRAEAIFKNAFPDGYGTNDKVDGKTFEQTREELRTTEGAFDPEITQNSTELLDPTNLIPLGAGAKAASKTAKAAEGLGKAAARGSLAAGLETKAAAAATKEAVQTGGEIVAEKLGRGITEVGSKIAAKTADGLSPLVSGGIFYAVSGGDPTMAALGALLGRRGGGRGAIAADAAEKAYTGVGPAVARLGARTAAGTSPLAKVTAAMVDVSAGAAKGAGAGAAVGGALALGADSPDEAKQLIANSAAFGALGGGGDALLHPFARARMGYQPDAEITRPEVAAYGTPWDAANEQGLATLSNRGAAEFEAIRQLAQGVVPEGDRAEIYAISDPEVLQKMATNYGVGPAAAASANGFNIAVRTKEGTTRHVAVVNLTTDNGGRAVGHEPGHIFWDVMSDEQRTAISNGIFDAYRPEQLAGFAENYEFRMATPEQRAANQIPQLFPRKQDGSIDVASAESDLLREEIFAEHASAYLAGVPLAQFGGSRKVGAQMRQFFGAIGEKLGLRGELSATKAPGEASTELGIEPSYTVTGILKGILATGPLERPAALGGPAKAAPPPPAAKAPPATPPAGAPPANGSGTAQTTQATPPSPPVAPAAPATPPAPAPAPVDPFAGREVDDVETVTPEVAPAPAAPLAENQRQNAAAVTRTANTVPPEVAKQVADSATREGGDPAAAVAGYQVITDALANGRSNAGPIRISYRVAAADGGVVDTVTREGEQLERDAGERGETVEDKLIVPISAPTQNAKGTWTFTGFDLSKFHKTLKAVRDWVAQNSDAGIADPFAGRDIDSDLIAYTQNHANGYLGDGRAYPAAFQQRDAVTPDPNYAPVSLPADVVTFLNAAMGTTPPAKLTPVLAGAVDVAGAMGVTGTPFGTKGSVDLNPIRAAVRAKGGDAALLFGGDRASANREGFTSVMRLDRIASVSPSPDTGLRPPNLKAVNAGFQPGRVAEQKGKAVVSSGMGFAADPAVMKAFTEKLRVVAANNFDGGTFNADGTPYTDGKKTPVIVTLGSMNFPAGEVTATAVQKFFNDHAVVLRNPNVKPGIFHFDGQVSADINVVLPRSQLEDAKKFAKDNDQHSIFLLNKDGKGGEVIETGGSGTTYLTTPREFRAAADLLAKGLYSHMSIVKRNADDVIDSKMLPNGRMEHAVKRKSFDAVHYTGKAGLTEIDPAFMKPKPGTNQKMYRGIQKSFFFVDGTTPLPGENVTPAKGVRYGATIPGNLIYDMDTDHFSVWDSVNRASAEQGLVDAGYKGFFLKTDDGRTFLGMFEPTPVKPLKGGNFQPARAVTQTPEFKQWFGDSKVVDAKGAPAVVYHGTAADFTVFDKTRAGEATQARTSRLGFFFTDNELAAGEFADGDGGNVIPAYLSLQNPLEIGMRTAKEREQTRKDPFISLRDAIVTFSKKKALTEPTSELPSDFDWKDVTPRDIDEWREAVKAGGFDGLIIRQTVMDAAPRSRANPYHDFFVAFDPTQIKSATGNKGKFDGTNPDIRFQPGPVELSPESVAKAPDSEVLNESLVTVAGASDEISPGRPAPRLPNGVRLSRLKTSSGEISLNATIDKTAKSLPKNALQTKPDMVFAQFDRGLERLRADPERFADPRGYVEHMRDVGVSGDVMVAPPLLKMMLTDPAKYVEYLEGGYHGEKTKAGTLEAADQGLDATLAMRKAIGEKPAPMVAALHHLWGILSRMLPPIEQEAMWLRLISRPEVLENIQKSIDGNYALDKTQWADVVRDARDASASYAAGRGNQGTANANAFHGMLSQWNGSWDAVSNVYSAPNSIESGRRFWALGLGKVGIKNKVQRFIGLTFGTPGLIMDRWKFVEFFMPQFGKAPRGYFAYSRTGTPEDPNGLYGTYGGIEGADEVLSLAFYEGMETVLEQAIKNSPELREVLGRHPNVGGLHWKGWNAIKNEAVGHSSLDLTYDLALKSKNPGPSDVLALIADKEYYTEGLVGNSIKRFTLRKGQP